MNIESFHSLLKHYLRNNQEIDKIQQWILSSQQRFTIGGPKGLVVETNSKLRYLDLYEYLPQIFLQNQLSYTLINIDDFIPLRNNEGGMLLEEIIATSSNFILIQNLDNLFTNSNHDKTILFYSLLKIVDQLPNHKKFLILLQESINYPESLLQPYRFDQPYCFEPFSIQSLDDLAKEASVLLKLDISSSIFQPLIITPQHTIDMIFDYFSDYYFYLSKENYLTQLLEPSKNNQTNDQINTQQIDEDLTSDNNPLNNLFSSKIIEPYGIETYQNMLLYELLGFPQAKESLRLTLPTHLLPNGIVLAGPTGVGKTYLLKWLSQKVQGLYHTIDVQCADLVHKEVGKSEQNIQKVFQQAKEKAPSLIFLDNLDILFQFMAASKAISRLLIALLQCMDEFKGHVIPIATVTNIESLDIALIRAGRFEEHIQLSVPSLDDRKGFIFTWLRRAFPKHDNLEYSQDFISSFSNKSDGWSYGRIEGWLRSSLFQAYEEYSLKISKTDLSESPITPFSFVLAIDSFVQILKSESQ